MDVWPRVAIALFVVVAPTLLFLGLWHGLTSLRDDDLAGEMTAHQLRGLFDVLPSGQPNAGRFEELPDGGIEVAVPQSADPPTPNELPSGRPAIEIGIETDPVECPHCEEPNPPGAELCWGCGAYLNDAESAE